MNKRERIKLHRIMEEMLGGLCVVKLVSDETELNPSRIEAVMQSSEYGNIAITFYNGTKSLSPWLACRFMDWPKDNHYPNPWKGWGHWKQNCHAQYKDALCIVDLFRNHLLRFKPLVMEEKAC